MRLIILLSLISTIMALPNAFAAQEFFYKEAMLFGGYSDREDWIGTSGELMNSLGFEYYRKFSNEYGDFLTTDLQMRLAYDSTETAEDVWGVQIHNAWVQYKFDPAYKVKIGHFDTPFGLEPVLDTHATLVQTLAAKNIGYKKDWGVALEGALPDFDYSAALQIGSGMSIRRYDNSFLASARVGTPSDGNAQAGLSLLYGNIVPVMGMFTFPRGERSMEGTVSKKRVGIDGQYLFGSYLFKGEAAYGQDEGVPVLGALYELDYTLPKAQNVELQLQYQLWRHDLGEPGSDDTTLTAGIAYKCNSRVTLRAALRHDINLMGGSEDDAILVQFYYFGI